MSEIEHRNKASLRNSNLNESSSPNEISQFEKERERFIKDIAHEFEQALNNSNMLGRRLEEVLGVGKEFKTIAALWGVFGNIVSEPNQNNDNIEFENSQDDNTFNAAWNGVPGTGSSIPGRRSTLNQ